MPPKLDEALRAQASSSTREPERGGVGYEPELSPTCTADWHNPAVLTGESETGCLNGWDVQSKRIYDPAAVGPTLPSGTSEGINIQPSVLTDVCIQGSMIGRADGNGPQGSGIETDGACFTLNCTDRHGVLAFAQNSRDEVRIQGDGAHGQQRPWRGRVRRDAHARHIGVGGGRIRRAHLHESPQHQRGDRDGHDGHLDVPPVRLPERAPMSACTLLVRCGCAGGGKGALVSDEVSLTLATTNMQTLFQEEGDEMIVRRLTPLECERLQGFPDNYTRIPYRGKPSGDCPDGPRYKAIGNSMAVPVMRWIGERIAMADKEAS